jgi:arylamine N-acetyltransferase
MSSETANKSILLNGGLCGRILDRLGLTPLGDPTINSLSTLYSAWCKNVPFDNVALLMYRPGSGMGGAMDLPIERFFEDWLREGIGGLCVPTALAWRALLESLQYDARCAFGSIDADGQQNHLTVIVRLDEGEYVVDTVNLCEQPIRLAEGYVRGPYRAHDVTVERCQTSWRLHYRSAAQREDQSCFLFPGSVSLSAAVELYLATLATPRFREFNRVLYTRRNSADGIVVVLGNAVTRVRQDGTATCSWDEDLERVLVDEIGYSPALARKLRERNGS